MSIFSDYEAGAMSYSEFRQACGHMNRVERGGSYGTQIYPYEGDDDNFDSADEDDADAWEVESGQYDNYTGAMNL